jgi:hypothetical protein
LLFTFFLGFGIARANELSDAISALQARYDSEIKALEAGKDAAIGQARERYLADLSSAERTSGAQGKLQEVAAITKEKENVAKGPLAPAFPNQLPAALTRNRNDYLAAGARVQRDFAARQERVNSDVLRTLTSYESKAKTGKRQRNFGRDCALQTADAFATASGLARRQPAVVRTYS